MGVFSKIKGRLKRRARDESGAATVEFVIVFPMLIAIVLSIFESGWLMTRYMMLDRGVDMAIRDVRLGKNTGGYEGIRDEICRFASIIKDCETDLILELVVMDLGSDYPHNQANCFDREEEVEPVISFDPGSEQDIMFVRACVIVDPIFPGIGLGLRLPKDSTGGFQMVSYSAYLNEPS